MKSHLFIFAASILFSSFGFAEQAGDVAVVESPKKVILKSARTQRFNKALYFDQFDNGVMLLPLELEYDLTGENGNILKIGNVILNEKTFFFSLLPLGKTHPKLSSILSPEEAAETVLIMKWPDKLIQSGGLEIISKSGKVLWQYDIKEVDRETWKKKLTQWRGQLVKAGIDSKEIGNGGIFGTQLALNDLKNRAIFKGIRESFRFCLSQSVGNSQSKLCSIWYGVRNSGNSTIMGKIRTEPAQPRVLVQNEAAALKDSKVISAEMPVSFYADLYSNQSYEFVTKPKKPSLMDIADTVKPGILRIVGFDTRPTNPSVILNPDQYGVLTKTIQFEDTIGDFRKFWMAALKIDNPVLYFPGEGGGVFKQKFILNDVPRNLSRPYLSTKTSPGTYVDGARLSGQKLSEVVVSSDQNSVVVNDQDPTKFEWKFKGTEKGAINKSYLNVNYQGKNYRAFTELFRGYSKELSVRFTGIAAASSFLMLGEVAYNHWFEDLYGWDNYTFSRLRWGLSAKYFQAFTKLKVDDAGTTADLNVLDVDAKYRLTPGLWGREETLGGMLSYQALTYDKISAPMIGFGAFWARSMPKVFDDIFNYVPLMRYPKFVDMEFIYYPVSLNSSVTLDVNFSLNFHGKVMWTKQLFGEAGFGMKRYAFTDAVANQQAELNTFYGTVGLGLNF